MFTRIQLQEMTDEMLDKIISQLEVELKERAFKRIMEDDNYKEDGYMANVYLAEGNTNEFFDDDYHEDEEF